ncbi:hypothetical protein ACF0H5_014037 [Mactra antiquata]
MTEELGKEFMRTYRGSPEGIERKEGEDKLPVLTQIYYSIHIAVGNLTQMCNSVCIDKCKTNRKIFTR